MRRPAGPAPEAPPVPAGLRRFRASGRAALWRAEALPLVLGAVAAALLPVPVFGVLHVEAAAVVAGVAFFAAGTVAVGRFTRGTAFGPVLTRSLAALVVPWALLTLSLAWAPNAGYVLGLGLFVLFTVPSVALAVALAWALAPGRRPRAAFWALGLGVLVATPLYDLGLHPQFYHYNHVFGGVLGPIYDEELAVRPGLFLFRGVTVGWALLAFLIGDARRGRRRRGAMGMVAVGLAGAYTVGHTVPGLHFVTPAGLLVRALGGHVRTAHFDLHFDPARTDAATAGRLARDHEWRYAWLAARLGVRPRARVQSYLYPDDDAKAALVGARRTSVAPVWLAAPQTHVVVDDVEAVFGHELVHAFSRGFGLPALHASRYVGLVEGLAVAFEPPDGLPGPHAQVSAAALADGGPVRDTVLAGRLAATLGGGRFWTGRGAVSYTTTGSFVAYLAARHGPAKVRAAYAWGDFARVYGRPVGALAADWARFVTDSLRVVPRGAGPFAEARFAVPSLFERPSPHHVPAYVRATRRADRALAAGDTAAALRSLDAALADAPAYAPALDRWARLRLARAATGRPAEARAVAARLRRDGGPVFHARLGDALGMLGQPDGARARYAAALAATPPYAHEAAVLLELRAMLAPHPGALRALYARRPWQGPDPAATAAFAWTAAAVLDDPAAALRRVAAVPLPSDPAALPGTTARAAAQAHAWRAEWADRADDLAAAGRHARRAAAAFAALGDADAAARWADLAAHAAWAEGRSP